MKKILVIGVAATFMFSRCSKDVPADTPSCVKIQIEQLKNQAKRNPAAEINEYIYKGRKVFLISAECCDQYNKLIDAKCNYICAPSGGLTGKGDGKCTDFLENAKHSRLIWKDPR
ncbi:MAG: hypothetical protein WKF97_10495 [Chitinophagaceae bacterium]